MAVGGVEVQETEGQGLFPLEGGAGLRRQAVFCGQRKPAAIPRQENAHPRDSQCARQALHDRCQQVGQIGLRAQASAELDQRLAIVVAMAVEHPIHPVLDASLQGLECGGHHHDGNPQSPLADRFGKPGMHHLADQRNHAEIAAQDKPRRQRIGHPALEDQVGVHQAITDDGPAECQRQEDDRKSGDTLERLRQAPVEDERHRVEQRERNHGEERAAREPFQLLAEQRCARAPVAAHEQRAGQHVEDGLIGRAGLVHPMFQQPRCLPIECGPDPQAELGRSGRINQRQQPGAMGPLQALFGEAQGKMHEQRRLQRVRDDVRPENRPVERIELARILQRVQRKRNQAEQVKMRGARGGPAPEQNVDADGKIDQADDPKAQRHAVVHRFGNDRQHQRGAVARYRVHRHLKCPGSVQHPLQVRNVRCGHVGNLRRNPLRLLWAVQILRQRLDTGEKVALLARGAWSLGGRGGFLVYQLFGQFEPGGSWQRLGAGQQIAGANSKPVTGASRQNLDSLEAPGCFPPPYAVIGLLDPALLPKVQNRKYHQADCGDSQQDSLDPV